MTYEYYYTGYVQSFTVPYGVTTITVEAYGAQGGEGWDSGGWGGYVYASLTVTPGQVLYVYVGGSGGGGGSSYVDGTVLEWYTGIHFWDGYLSINFTPVPTIMPTPAPTSMPSAPTSMPTSSPTGMPTSSPTSAPTTYAVSQSKFECRASICFDSGSH